MGHPPHHREPGAGHHGADHSGSGSAAAAASTEHPKGAALHAHQGMAHDEHGQHGGGHAGHSEEVFARPFWVSLALTIPVVVYAELIQELLGYTAPRFPGSAWLVPVLASVIYWYGGWVFLSGAVAELRRLRPGMMALVALAITVAYGYSLAITFGVVPGMPFYWELAALVTIMLLGHWLELRAVGSAQGALTALAKLLPDTAERLGDGHPSQVPVADLRPDDLVLVRPGARVPADGTVAEGHSDVDEGMVTGESRPVAKQQGSVVIGGTVNGSGSLRVRVGKVGDETVLAGIMRLVQDAQTSRTRAQTLADRAAFGLTLIAVGVAALALVGWTLARGFDLFAFERAVTTLVIACPHALGLAIPLVIAISTTLSARNGILVRDRTALETARDLDVVVFDKTGTLTKGEQGLVDLAAIDGLDEARALALAAAVEADSEHMLARALTHAARERGLTVPPVERFQALAGRGVQAVVDGHVLRVGGPRLLEQEGDDVPEALAERARVWGERGQTVVYLLDQRRPLAAFATADVIRPESGAAIAALKERGVRVAMLTGDSEEVARWVAGELGIGEYFAQVLPEQKSERVRALQVGGVKVAMVGDGINDAPALARADVGIAIGAGTDVAMASAGIILIRNDPRDVARVITLSRATYRKMVQNLGWAVGYNAFALPAAAGAFAPFGLVLPVWLGAALMSLSTIIVAINAQTLRRLRL